MISNYKIDFITKEQTLDLRQRSLRPFLAKSECQYPEDGNTETKHFGLFYNGNIVSIATIFPQSYFEFSSGNPYRLRGMATDSNFRGQGFGSFILMTVFDYLKVKRCDLLWCHARIRATSFYRSNGFLPHAQVFDVPQTGPHQLIYKRIIPK